MKAQLIRQTVQGALGWDDQTYGEFVLDCGEAFARELVKQARLLDTSTNRSALGTTRSDNMVRALVLSGNYWIWFEKQFNNRNRLLVHKHLSAEVNNVMRFEDRFRYLHDVERYAQLKPNRFVWEEASRVLIEDEHLDTPRSSALNVTINDEEL